MNLGLAAPRVSLAVLLTQMVNLLNESSTRLDPNLSNVKTAKDYLKHNPDLAEVMTTALKNNDFWTIINHRKLYDGAALCELKSDVT